MLSGVTLAAAGPAGAVPARITTYGTPAPIVTVNASNQTLTVVVTGLPPNLTVTIYIAGVPVMLGTGTTDATGALNSTFPLPPGLAPGVHTVMITGSGVNLSAVVNLTQGSGTVVVSSNPAGSSDPAPSSGHQLPFTGADVATGTALGAAAVAVGGVLVLSSRKRRRAGFNS
jgi:hypothetical protein